MSPDDEGAVLHKQRSDSALGLVDLSFDDGTHDLACRVGTNIHIIRDQQYTLEQVVNTLFLVWQTQAPPLSLPPHSSGTSSSSASCCFTRSGFALALSILFNRHNDRNPGGFCMRDRFPGLRHHAVVCCHDQDHNIRTLRTPGTHGCKGRMTGSIEKSDRAPLLLHLVGADMLSNAAGFASCDFGLPNRIQKGCFSMVDVPKDRDDRGPRH